MDIKKPNKVFPKIFRTFTKYIIIVLVVFFGYVELFGNVKPNVLTLPVGDAGANDETYFSQFVQNISNFQNIKIDGLNLNFEGSGIELDLTADAVYDDSGVKVALDLEYNGQNFAVDVVYTAPNVYLTTQGKTYKFDTTLASGAQVQVDPMQLVDFATKNLGIDFSFVDKIGEALGIDFNNFDPNSLLSKLKIEEKQFEDGSYQFVIRLGSAIEGVLKCDQNFCITSVATNPITISGNKLKLSAPSVEMNKDEIEVVFNEKGKEIVNMSGLVVFGEHAAKLFENNHVAANINLQVDGKTYNALLQVDPVDKAARLSTQVDGLNLALAFKDEQIFVDANELKLKIAAKDFAEWKDKICALIEKQTGKKVEDLLGEMLTKLGIDTNKLAEMTSGEVDTSTFAKSILSAVFANQEVITEYLPQTATLTKDEYSMHWQQGADVVLKQKDGQLCSLQITHDAFNLQATFAAVEDGVVIDGVYYDVTNLLPLLDVADNILTAQKFAGDIKIVYNEKTYLGGYVVDYSGDVMAQVTLSKAILTLCGRDVYLQIDEIVVCGSLDDLQDYILRINQIFGTELALPELENVSGAASLGAVANILNNLKLLAGEGDQLGVIQYLSGIGEIYQKSETAEIVVKFGDVQVSASIGATDESIALPESAESISGIFNKIENVKNYVYGNKYAVKFDAKIEGVHLAGIMEVDLENNIYQLSGFKVGGHDVVIRYEDNVVYINYENNKLKLDLDNAEKLYKVVAKILAENMPEEDAKEDLAGDPETQIKEYLTKFLGEDVTDLSIKEIVEKISFSLKGTTNNLGIEATFATTNPVKVQVDAKFVKDQISSLTLTNKENKITLDVLAFELKPLTDAEKAEYYSILSGQEGELQLTAKVGKETLTFTFALQADLTDKIYIRAAGSVCAQKVEGVPEKNIEVIVFNDQVRVRIDQIVLQADLSEAADLFDQIVSTFGIKIAKKDDKKFDMQSLLSTLAGLNLNGIDALNIDGLNYSVNSQGLETDYAINEKLSLSVKLHSAQDLDIVTNLPSGEQLKDVLPQIKYIVDYVQQDVYELGFDLVYNQNDQFGGLKLTGTLMVKKNGQLEVKDVKVCNELFSLYMFDSTLYIAYGNMKIKVPFSSGEGDPVSLADKIDEFLNKDLGVDLQFGQFKDILQMLADNKTMQDWLNNIVLGITGSTKDICLAISKRQEMSTPWNFANIEIMFKEEGENVLFDKATVQVLDLLSGTITLAEKPDLFPDFDASQFADYTDKFIDGVLNSLVYDEQIVDCTYTVNGNAGEETVAFQRNEVVYAFSSDIAIRYSTEDFYGKLTAMVVKTEKLDQNGAPCKDKKGNFIVEYKPALALYTNSLGLSTYIYLVDNTVYVDINGLQLKTALDAENIDALVQQLEDSIHKTLLKDQSGNKVSIADMLKKTGDGFRMLIPALDNVYAHWIELTEGKTLYGIQLNIAELRTPENSQAELHYMQDGKFTDIVLQVFIENCKSLNDIGTIVPTKLVFGANITDPNTHVQEDKNYFVNADCLLENEEAITQSLNFAVYLNNIQVGKFTENLKEMFKFNDKTYTVVEAVKSNDTLTNLADFNDAEAVVTTIGAAYDWGTGLHYNLSVSGDITSTSQVLNKETGAYVTVTQKTEINPTSFAGNSYGANNILVAVEDEDPNNAASQKAPFNLDGKRLNVQANNLTIGITKDNVPQATHQVSLLYSTNYGGLYVTYSHDNLADDNDNSSKNKNNNNIGNHDLKVKIDNSRMSELAAIIVNFLGLDISDEELEKWSLTKDRTDFAYIKSLLKKDGQEDVTPDLPQVDQYLKSVEKIAEIINHIQYKDGADTISLIIEVNMKSFNQAETDQIGTIQIDLSKTTSQDITTIMPKAITITNVAVDNMVINFSLQISPYNTAKQTTKTVKEDVTTVVEGKEVQEQVDKTYVVLDKNFDYNNINYAELVNNEEAATTANVINYLSADHQDVSNLPDILDPVVNTVNQKHFNYLGTASIDIAFFGWDRLSFEGLAINRIDLQADINDNGKLSLFAQFDVASHSLSTGDFIKRISTLSYKDGKITVERVSKASKSKGFLQGSYEAIQKEYSETFDTTNGLGMQDIITIFKQILGLKSALSGLLDSAIKNIDARPTIERSFKSFAYNQAASSFDVKLNGDNLTGDSGMFGDIDLGIGIGGQQNVTFDGEASTLNKTLKFIDSIATTSSDGVVINLAGIATIKIRFGLNSITDQGDEYITEFLQCNKLVDKKVVDDEGVTIGGVKMNTNEYWRKQYIADWKNRTLTAWQEKQNKIKEDA